MGIAKPEFASMDSETTPDVFAIRLIIAIIVSPSKYLLYTLRWRTRLSMEYLFSYSAYDLPTPKPPIPGIDLG